MLGRVASVSLLSQPWSSWAQRQACRTATDLQVLDLLASNGISRHVRAQATDRARSRRKERAAERSSYCSGRLVNLLVRERGVVVHAPPFTCQELGDTSSRSYSQTSLRSCSWRTTPRRTSSAGAIAHPHEVVGLDECVDPRWTTAFGDESALRLKPRARCAGQVIGHVRIIAHHESSAPGVVRERSERPGQPPTRENAPRPVRVPAGKSSAAIGLGHAPQTRAPSYIASSCQPRGNPDQGPVDP